MASARHVQAADDALEVTFTGLLPLKALRRRLTIPYSWITSTSTEPFGDRSGLVRMAGYALGDSLHGLFRQHGRWLFFSFEDPEQVIHISLEAADQSWPRLSEVVLQVPSPVALSAQIDACARVARSAPRPI